PSSSGSCPLAPRAPPAEGPPNGAPGSRSSNSLIVGSSLGATPDLPARGGLRSRPLQRAAETVQNRGMVTPSVLVFATGGTIGMHETDAGLASDPDFPEILERLVADICRSLRIEARINHLLPAIDSANADAETAPRIARAI